MSEFTDSFDAGPDPEPVHTEFHLSDYWAIVVKHRRLIFACIALAAIAGVLITVSSRPMYRAVVVLDVVRQSTNPLGMGRSVAGSDANGDPEFLPSQIELIQSRDVAERVVNKLNLLADPSFTSPRSGIPKKVLSRHTPEEIAGAALRVKGSTDATIVRGTSLIQISYEAPNPRLAATLANGVADAYIEWNIESRFRQIGQSAEFLATQIEQTKRDIAEKEKALLTYARQKDLSAGDPRTSSSERMESFGRDYSVAVADRVAKEAHYQEVQNTPAATLAETTAAGLVAQIKDEQARLERDYNEKLNLYKPEWPAMQQLKKQVEDGRQRVQLAVQDTAAKIREAAHADYMTALRREASLQSMMRSQQSEALSQGATTSEYSNLRTEVDTKRTLLDTLLKQQGEAEVLSRLREQQLTNIRIVDRALPPRAPFKPSAFKNIAGALVVGVVAGIALALFLSYLDRSLRSADQVERYLQLPALGAIPFSGPTGKTNGWSLKKSTPSAKPSKSIELLPHREPRSAIAEAYRAFRTSLLFSRAGGVRIVAVTSVVPQEGKSTTAVNLAIVLAQLGRRVLLVDADLHRSRIHRILDIPNNSGLVSILAESVEPSRVIVKSAIPGVFVVPSGPETPNPSGLLASADMQKFLELAATNFDHVVVDTPPVLATSDALVFGQHTDGVVICVRAGQTPRDQVRRVRDKLLRGGVLILGVLLNGLELDSDYYGGYEYRYLNYGERLKAIPEDPPKSELTAV